MRVTRDSRVTHIDTFDADGPYAVHRHGDARRHDCSERHSGTIEIGANATRLWRSVLPLMWAALDAVPSLGAAPGVAVSKTRRLAAGC